VSDLNLTNLFRKQAIEHATRRLEGEVILATPISLWWTIIVVLIFVAAGFGVGSIARYSRHITGSGWIVPQSGAVFVTTPYDGIVVSAIQQEGQIVGVNRALLTLDRATSDVAGWPSAKLNAGTANETGGVVNEFNKNVVLAPPNIKGGPLNRSVLTSPISGSVLVTLPTQGDEVTTGETVAVMAPLQADMPLMAELYVSSQAARVGRVGQRVELHYKTARSGNSGVAMGVVENISAKPTLTDSIASPGTSERGPFFLVSVKLDKAVFKFKDRTIPMNIGMRVDGDIITERRSVLHWILNAGTDDQ
jgi:multidrug efflux pump subunit AcrA (membrane-fusion protein)